MFYFFFNSEKSPLFRLSHKDSFIKLSYYHLWQIDSRFWRTDLQIYRSKDCQLIFSKSFREYFCHLQQQHDLNVFFCNNNSIQTKFGKGLPHFFGHFYWKTFGPNLPFPQLKGEKLTLAQYKILSDLQAYIIQISYLQLIFVSLMQFRDLQHF